ncbi:MAG TPA: tyrosine-type recombinase/integrase, partial [Thermomicrobiales bacterium]|nr:tyrosine-type recombinase/integrase [Thermomicrobiales bacterium]
IAGDRWQGEAWGLVFCSTIGTPLDPSNVTKQYRALLQAAGLEQRRFHDLRHSTGSFLASRGVHPRIIMEILGHSQVSTTMNTYTHVELGSMRDALDELGDLLDADKASS